MDLGADARSNAGAISGWWRVSPLVRHLHTRAYLLYPAAGRAWADRAAAARDRAHSRRPNTYDPGWQPLACRPIDSCFGTCGLLGRSANYRRNGNALRTGSGDSRGSNPADSGRTNRRGHLAGYAGYPGSCGLPGDGHDWRFRQWDWEIGRA